MPGHARGWAVIRTRLCTFTCTPASPGRHGRRRARWRAGGDTADTGRPTGKRRRGSAARRPDGGALWRETRQRAPSDPALDNGAGAGRRRNQRPPGGTAGTAAGRQHGGGDRSSEADLPCHSGGRLTTRRDCLGRLVYDDRRAAHEHKGAPTGGASTQAVDVFGTLYLPFTWLIPGSRGSGALIFTRRFRPRGAHEVLRTDWMDASP